VNFVDNPRFLIGSQAEREGTARTGARALMAVYQAGVPWVPIVLRRAFGVAGTAHGNARGSTCACRGTGAQDKEDAGVERIQSSRAGRVKGW
jgi:hypothetical protein